MCKKEDYRKYELDNCTFVKTGLMLIVVLYHSCIFWRGNWFTSNPVFEAKSLAIFAEWLNTFHIYGFTLVAGYVFYYLKEEKKRYSEFIPFVVNKLKRLIIPYIIVSVIWVIPFLYVYKNPGFWDIIRDYVLGVSPSQLWFLMMLFNVYTIAWIISPVFSKDDKIGLFVIASIYIIGVIGAGIIPNIFQIWTSCKYVLIFFIGFLLRKHGSECFMKIPSIIWIGIDIFVFVLYKCFLRFEGISINILLVCLGELLHIVGALMAFVIFQKISAHINREGIWGFLGKYTMTIYLFHQQIIYILILGTNGMINPYLNVMIIFSVALCLSVLISNILLKFKIGRIIVGEK